MQPFSRDIKCAFKAVSLKEGSVPPRMVRMILADTSLDVFYFNSYLLMLVHT
jgi:hypothetical protein